MPELTRLHVILTWRCDRRCDHCDVGSGPEAGGAIRDELLDRLVEQLADCPSITRLVLDGGEPFLDVDRLERVIARLKPAGREIEAITDAVWAADVPTVERVLRRLRKAGLGFLTVSYDRHHGTTDVDRQRLRAAVRGAKSACVKPEVCNVRGTGERLLGELIAEFTTVPIRYVSLRHIGRGAALATGGDGDRGGVQPQPITMFDACPHELLGRHDRVDPEGNLVPCPGIILGNIEDTPLARLIRPESLAEHPIVGPLDRGGPAALFAANQDVLDPADSPLAEGAADACHACYLVRKRLRAAGKHKLLLGPAQVYAEP